MMQCEHGIVNPSGILTTTITIAGDDSQSTLSATPAVVWPLKPMTIEHSNDSFRTSEQRVGGGTDVQRPHTATVCPPAMNTPVPVDVTSASDYSTNSASPIVVEAATDLTTSTQSPQSPPPVLTSDEHTIPMPSKRYCGFGRNFLLEKT